MTVWVTCSFIVAFLDNVCKHGLPKKEDVFDFAALCVLRYERKRKTEKMKELQERIKKRQNQFDIIGIKALPIVYV